MLYFTYTLLYLTYTLHMHNGICRSVHHILGRRDGGVFEARRQVVGGGGGGGGVVFMRLCRAGQQRLRVPPQKKQKIKKVLEALALLRRCQGSVKALLRLD